MSRYIVLDVLWECVKIMLDLSISKIIMSGDDLDRDDDASSSFEGVDAEPQYHWTLEVDALSAILFMRDQNGNDFAYILARPNLQSTENERGLKFTLHVFFMDPEVNAIADAIMDLQTGPRGGVDIPQQTDRSRITGLLKEVHESEHKRRVLSISDVPHDLDGEGFLRVLLNGCREYLRAKGDFVNSDTTLLFAEIENIDPNLMRELVSRVNLLEEPVEAVEVSEVADGFRGMVGTFVALDSVPDDPDELALMLGRMLRPNLGEEDC
jgi:hypothetical protein